MAGWLIPALKAVLPHVGEIVAAAKPAFTRRKDELAQAAAGLLEQQIAELQAAASQNSAHIKELAAQLQLAQAQLRRVLVVCTLATGLSFAALGVAVFTLLAR